MSNLVALRQAVWGVGLTNFRERWNPARDLLETNVTMPNLVVLALTLHYITS